MVRAVAPWFGVIARMCVTIAILSIQAHAVDGTLGATEDFGNCFGEPTEDINLCVMVRENQAILITSFVLIVMAAYSLELMAERWVTLAIARKQSLSFLLRVGTALFHRRFDEAVAISSDYPNSPVALAVDAFVRSNKGELRPDSEALNPSMHEWQRAIVIRSAEIKRRLWTLGAIGWSAPLLGLLYASLRITQALQWWQAAQGNSFAPYADEIARAAWGVSFSIVVAIPAIWAHRYLTAQAETMVLEMQNLSLAVIEQLCDRQVSSPPNASSASYITQELNAKDTRRTHVDYVAAFGHDIGP
jgi:biopolymer transport protein ExbB/TolQ